MARRDLSERYSRSSVYVGTCNNMYIILENRWTLSFRYYQLHLVLPVPVENALMYLLPAYGYSTVSNNV